MGEIIKPFFQKESFTKETVYHAGEREKNKKIVSKESFSKERFTTNIP